MSDFQLDGETIEKLTNTHRNLQELRGEPNEELDQYFINIETALKRAQLFNPRDYDGKRLMIIGDMDLISLFIGKLSTPKDLVVMDIDKRLPELIFKLKFKEKIRSIRFVNHDIRVRMLAVMKNQFEYIFIEPPFTVEGLELGLSRAVQCARKDTEPYIVLSWDYEKNVKEVVKKFVEEMNLELVKVYDSFNSYIYKTPLGKYSSDLFLIKVRTDSKETISDHYYGPLYYRESKEKPKSYRCKCGHIIKIGEGGEYEKLEDLEESGCPICGYKGKFLYNSTVPIL